MKKSFKFGLFAAVVLSAFTYFPAMSQFKIDVDGQALISHFKHAERESKTKGVANLMSDKTILTIVSLGSQSAISEMEQNGCIIRDVMNDLAVVEMPISSLGDVSKLPSVNYISTQKEVSISNDMAREASGVNAIRAGVVDSSGKPLGYDVNGAGVVVGLMDTGLDPNHINFKASNGNSRVKGISQFTSSSGVKNQYLTPDEIANFTTETTGQTHGTHVLGIMAGSYADEANDYSGVATASDIYVSCGGLYDANIVLGVRDILEYAKSVGKPAVINLSLGNTAGSHDEYAYFAQYLDYYVNSYQPCPIITISSGNDAGKSIAIKKSLTKENNSFSTVMAFNASVSSTLSGNLDIYGDDSTPFVLKPFIYDMTNAEIVATLEPMYVTGTGFEKTFYCYETFDEMPIPALAQYFSGSIGIQSELANGSNRYHIAFSPKLKARTSTSYVFGFTVEGVPGHTVYAYHYSSLGTTFSTGNNPDFIAGGPDGTVNGIATGRRVAVVGSYNTRNSWKNFEGKEYGYYSNPSYQAGLISSFSSWGTLWDGRNLPHFVAPGSMISSSLNGYNMDSSSPSLDDPSVTKKVTANERTHYWGVMKGTSMASPFAGGVFALWKQVNPDLTIEDAVWIAQETATVDEFVTESGVKAGAGKLNAEAGLQMVLSGAGVESVIADGGTPFIVKTLDNNCFEVRSASNVRFNAKVYSVSGHLCQSVSAPDGFATIDCRALPKGVYLLTIEGSSFSGSRKIIVK